MESADGLVAHDAAFARVMGRHPRLARVIECPAHEGPVYVADDDALYATSVPTPEPAARILRKSGRALPPRAADAPRARPVHEWCSVAFTSLVSILPNDQHETSKLKISTGAHWTFLADEELTVQRDLDIREYTDTHHAANVPYTLVLAPNLVVDKIYCGYWF
jgi:hypothetical protein